MRLLGTARSERGIALATALLVATFFFILSLSLLSVVERDSHFDLVQECQLRAYVTARAGLEFFKREYALPIFNLPGLLPGVQSGTVTKQVDDPQFLQQFQVYTRVSLTLAGAVDVCSIGTIASSNANPLSNSPLATRKLVAPSCDFTRIQDMSQ